MAGMEFIFKNKALDVINELNKAGERTLKRCCMEIEKVYKQNLRDKLNNYGVAKGDLMNSATHEVELRGMDSKGIVGNKKVYARIHEFGGVINAKNAEYLVFRTADGEWHKVKSVTIPARPTLRPAVLDDPKRLERIAAEEFGKAKT